MKVETGATGNDGPTVMVVDEKRDKQRAKYIWRCEICGRCLCSKRSYSEHKNTHNAARPFKCESCDYAAASQMTLRRHTLRQHVPRSHWHYPCPYCEQAFVEPTSYQAHLRHKHAGHSGTFGCDKCDYKTLSSKNFIDHVVKHAHVRSKKRSASKLKDFTDRELICKCLVTDELGVGWGQRPVGAIDEQELSLRRVTITDQEKRKRAGPFISAVFSTAADRPSRLRVGPKGISNGSDAARETARYGLRTPAAGSSAVQRPEMVGTSMDYDHEYQSFVPNYRPPTTSSRGRVSVRGGQHGSASFPRRRVAPALSDCEFGHPSIMRFSNSIEQTCPVPEAECYVEVASEAYSTPAEMVEDEENEASSTSDSGSDNDDDDDDSASCTSGNSVEIGMRLTALTAEIDMAAERGIDFDDGCEQECQDLGNDILPDGQVDFDLD